MSDFVSIDNLCFRKSQFQSGKIKAFNGWGFFAPDNETMMPCWALKIKLIDEKHVVFFDYKEEAEAALQKIIEESNETKTQT